MTLRKYRLSPTAACLFSQLQSAIDKQHIISDKQHETLFPSSRPWEGVRQQKQRPVSCWLMVHV
jgi:hypothetical protein